MAQLDRLRPLAGAICTASLLVFLPWSAAADNSIRPNIILIMADDLGWGDLGCYGAPDIRTPYIDGLAAAGVRFTNFHASCTVCSPTRAALMTGRFPDLAGVPGVIRTDPANSWGYLSPSLPTLPEKLKERGYQTALIGKWHLGLTSPNLPNLRGFDYFKGFLGDMMDDYRTHRRHGINYMRENGREIDPQGHATDLFAEWASERISQSAREKKRKPFFLYLAFNAPHVPVQPPDADLARVRARWPDLSPARASLAALIEHMDNAIGRVLRILRDRGLEEKTLVIFTSDNGGQLDVGSRNGPHRGGKQDLYQGGLLVPFIARWPGRIPAGTTSSALSATMDVPATLLGIVGAESIGDGLDLGPALTGRALPEKVRELVWVRREGGGRYQGLQYEAVRRGPWKLVRNSPLAPFELYNLEDDPREAEDLVDRKREQAGRLRAMLQRHLQRAGSVPWQPPSPVAAPGP